MRTTILFLIQTHKDHQHIYRLVNLLLRALPRCQVLISHDENSARLDPAPFLDPLRVHVISGQGGRGDFSIVEGYIRALGWLKKNQVAYDWLINLSGSDYPVISLRDMEQELAEATVDGFLQHFDVLTDEPASSSTMGWQAGHAYERYYFQYRKLATHAGIWLRAMLAAPRRLSEKLKLPVRVNTAYGVMVGLKAKRHPFNAGFRCYAGSYWHVIRRECAQQLLQFIHNHDQIVDYYRKVLVPDEAFVPSILANMSNFTFDQSNRRYFDMQQSRHGHPKILNLTDLDRICTGEFFFARKIEGGSGDEMLDRLDGIALS